MKKVASIVFSLICFILILVPLLLTETEEGAISGVDGRLLAEKPIIGNDGYTTGMEAWLKDRLGFGDYLKIIYETANDRAFGELINPVYQYGRGKYTFYKIHNNIQYNSYHTKFVDMVTKMKEYCESRGTRFYFVFNPEKETLYREQLPAGVNYNDEWADRMLGEMSERGVNCIDLRMVLKNVAKDEKVFDQKNDAGHWNQNGAFYGMRELTKRMHEDLSRVKVLEKDEYDISSLKIKKIYASNQDVDEIIPVYSLKSGFKDITGELKNELKIDQSNPYFQRIENDSENAEGIEKLLLFEDDLHDQFAFARSKDTLEIYCLQNAVNFDYYYNFYKPDVVVFECMESVINDECFSEAEIEAKDPNPAILEIFPEESFSGRKDALLNNIDDFSTDGVAVLIPGKEIDNVFLSDSLYDARYAWLITEDDALDFLRNGQNTLRLSMRHGELEDGDDVVLCIQTNDGEKKKAVISVTTGLRNLSEASINATRNTKADLEKDTAIMTASTQDNVFGYTTVEIYNEDFTERIGEAATGYAPGTISGDYTHNMPDGDYKLLLTARGNLDNEWVAYDAHLEKGKTYWISYNVDELSAERVKVSGFSCSEPLR